MKMELDLLKNWTSFKSLCEMIIIKSFRNPKNQFQDPTETYMNK
jgi:hypothetical protein